MALNLKNPEVEALAAEVAKLAGETKTEAIRKALLERKARLRPEPPPRASKEEMIQYFERFVWPNIPPEELGRTLTREEEDAILGYGPYGV